MNLLLLEETEVQEGRVVLRGRRARHVLDVLKKSVGDQVRAGIIGQGTCVGTLVAADGRSVTLHTDALLPSAPPRVHAIVAVPRPKVVSRLVAAAASFGLRSLTFVNAWRVEKSYFASPRLALERLRQDALLGCEQGAQVWAPEIRVAPRLVPFFEEESPRLYPPDAPRLVLHPSAPTTLVDSLAPATGGQRDVVLAWGPEGGWIQRELETLEECGFSPARLGTGPLRTEVAVAAALGQLAMLQDVRAPVGTNAGEDWQLPSDG